MALPTEAELAAWVARELEALDDRPTVPKGTWKYNARGHSTLGAALATAPPHTRLDFRVPVPEFRIMRRCAEARGLPARTWARRMLGTGMVLFDGIEPEEITTLLSGGMILPRE